MPDVLDAFAWKFDYDNNKLPGETKAQFAKRKIAEYGKSILIEHLDYVSNSARQATAAAQRQAEIDTWNLIDIQ